MIKKYWPIFIIFGLPTTVILSASFLFFYQKEINLVDHIGIDTVGELVSPPFLFEEIILLDKKDMVKSKFTPGKWHLLVLSKEQCSHCNEHIHDSKQMITALGKHRNKIERHIVKKMNGVSSSKDIILTDLQWDKLQKKVPFELGKVNYLLIDPRGWLMMSYGSTTSEKAMMKDLKHLFTYVQ